jgi:hypothetical protein
MTFSGCPLFLYHEFLSNLRAAGSFMNAAFDGQMPIYNIISF